MSCCIEDTGIDYLLDCSNCQSLICQAGLNPRRVNPILNQNFWHHDYLNKNGWMTTSHMNDIITLTGHKYHNGCFFLYPTAYELDDHENTRLPVSPEIEKDGFEFAGVKEKPLIPNDLDIIAICYLNLHFFTITLSKSTSTRENFDVQHWQLKVFDSIPTTKAKVLVDLQKLFDHLGLNTSSIEVTVENVIMQKDCSSCGFHAYFNLFSLLCTDKKDRAESTRWLLEYTDDTDIAMRKFTITQYLTMLNEFQKELVTFRGKMKLKNFHEYGYLVAYDIDGNKITYENRRCDDIWVIPSIFDTSLAEVHIDGHESTDTPGIKTDMHTLGMLCQENVVEHSLKSILDIIRGNNQEVTLTKLLPLAKKKIFFDVATYRQAYQFNIRVIKDMRSVEHSLQLIIDIVRANSQEVQLTKLLALAEKTVGFDDDTCTHQFNIKAIKDMGLDVSARDFLLYLLSIKLLTSTFEDADCDKLQKMLRLVTELSNTFLMVSLYGEHRGERKKDGPSHLCVGTLILVMGSFGSYISHIAVTNERYSNLSFGDKCDGRPFTKRGIAGVLVAVGQCYARYLNKGLCNMYTWSYNQFRKRGCLWISQGFSEAKITDRTIWPMELSNIIENYTFYHEAKLNELYRLKPMYITNTVKFEIHPERRKMYDVEYHLHKAPFFEKCDSLDLINELSEHDFAVSYHLNNFSRDEQAIMNHKLFSILYDVFHIRKSNILLQLEDDSKGNDILLNIMMKDKIVPSVALDYFGYAMMIQYENVYVFSYKTTYEWYHFGFDKARQNMMLDSNLEGLNTEFDLLEFEAENKNVTFFFPIQLPKRFNQKDLYVLVCRKWIGNDIHFLLADTSKESAVKLYSNYSTTLFEYKDIIHMFMNTPLWRLGQEASWSKVPNIQQVETECGSRLALHSYMLFQSKSPHRSLLLLNGLDDDMLHLGYFSRKWLSNILKKKRWSVPKWVKKVMARDKTHRYTTKWKNKFCHSITLDDAVHELWTSDVLHDKRMKEHQLNTALKVAGYSNTCSDEAGFSGLQENVQLTTIPYKDLSDPFSFDKIQECIESLPIRMTPTELYTITLQYTSEHYMVRIKEETEFDTGYSTMIMRLRHYSNGELPNEKEDSMLRNCGDLIAYVDGHDMSGQPFDYVLTIILQAKEEKKDLRLTMIDRFMFAFEFIPGGSMTSEGKNDIVPHEATNTSTVKNVPVPNPLHQSNAVIDISATDIDLQASKGTSSVTHISVPESIQTGRKDGVQQKSKDMSIVAQQTTVYVDDSLSRKSHGVGELLTDVQMQSRVELLCDVENFVNVKELLLSVQKLMSRGKFSSLGYSNVVQFKKDCRDINFGFWGNIVAGRRKEEKAAKVKDLKKQFIKLFQTSRLIDAEHICWDELEMTALFTDAKCLNKQDPHTDYCLLATDNPINLAWTAHLPINKEEGSYIYIWSAQGCGTAVHIEGGQCLLLRSDVIHSGGVPEGCGVSKSFVRLHFYLPTKFQKPPPLGESIYRSDSSGVYYYMNHWHTEPIDSSRINNGIFIHADVTCGNKIDSEDLVKQDLTGTLPSTIATPEVGTQMICSNVGPISINVDESLDDNYKAMPMETYISLDDFGEVFVPDDNNSTPVMEVEPVGLEMSMSDSKKAITHSNEKISDVDFSYSSSDSGPHPWRTPGTQAEKFLSTFKEKSNVEIPKVTRRKKEEKAKLVSGPRIGSTRFRRLRPLRRTHQRHIDIGLIDTDEDESEEDLADDQVVEYVSQIPQLCTNCTLGIIHEEKCSRCRRPLHENCGIKDTEGNNILFLCRSCSEGEKRLRQTLSSDTTITQEWGYQPRHNRKVGVTVTLTEVQKATLDEERNLKIAMKARKLNAWLTTINQIRCKCENGKLCYYGREKEKNNPKPLCERFVEETLFEFFQQELSDIKAVKKIWHDIPSKLLKFIHSHGRCYSNDIVFDAYHLCESQQWQFIKFNAEVDKTKFLVDLEEDFDRTTDGYFSLTNDKTKGPEVKFVPLYYMRVWTLVCGRDLALGQQNEVTNIEKHAKKFRNQWVDIPAGSYKRKFQDLDKYDVNIPQSFRLQPAGEHSCVFNSLINALHYINDYTGRNVLMDNLPMSLDYEKMSLVSHSRAAFAAQIMNKEVTGYQIQILKNFDILQNRSMWPTLCVLKGSDFSINHAVTVVENYIFDSNRSCAMKLTKTNLDWCCSDFTGKQKFVAVHTAYRFNKLKARPETLLRSHDKRILGITSIIHAMQQMNKNLLQDSVIPELVEIRRTIEPNQCVIANVRELLKTKRFGYRPIILKHIKDAMQEPYSPWPSMILIHATGTFHYRVVSIVGDTLFDGTQGPSQRLTMENLHNSVNSELMHQDEATASVELIFGYRFVRDKVGDNISTNKGGQYIRNNKGAENKRRKIEHMDDRDVQPYRN